MEKLYRIRETSLQDGGGIGLGATHSNNKVVLTLEAADELGGCYHRSLEIPLEAAGPLGVGDVISVKISKATAAEVDRWKDDRTTAKKAYADGIRGIGDPTGAVLARVT